LHILKVEKIKETLLGIITNATDKHQACIDVCNKWVQACYECFNECLQEPDIQARDKCIRSLIECAQMCQMSAGLMSLNASMAKEHCKLCAEICKMCAKECDKFKDDHCKQCADVCRMCADECRKMAKQ